MASRGDCTSSSAPRATTGARSSMRQPPTVTLARSIPAARAFAMRCHASLASPVTVRSELFERGSFELLFLPFNPFGRTMHHRRVFGAVPVVVAVPMDVEPSITQVAVCSRILGRAAGYVGRVGSTHRQPAMPAPLGEERRVLPHSQR